MAAIIIFFLAHWYLSVFFQSFFLHRYAAHKMITMNKFWERIFHFMTFITQGTSFLNPRAYAILHREHHAFSDTTRDPHSPSNHKNVVDMMLFTKKRYDEHADGTGDAEKQFLGNYPEWPLIDNMSQSWIVRLAFGTFYTLFYVKFATEAWMFALLPIHYLMGPVHGAIVNWFGHYVGYRNFPNSDKSVNALPIDFLTVGELFQNNHHKHGARISFAHRWFEVDPTYLVLRFFKLLGIIKFSTPKNMLHVGLTHEGELEMESGLAQA
jgi:stearoyl-CoA desaturase (Delta-9 desaturase)